MVALQGSFPSDSSSIPQIRSFVLQPCRQEWSHPSDAEALAELELAVSEAASNIVLHGFKPQQSGPIDLQLQVDEEQVHLSFSYPGVPFYPHSAPAPDFSGSSESGFGMYLIQKCVDELHYSRSPDGICKIDFIKKRK